MRDLCLLPNRFVGAGLPVALWPHGTPGPPHHRFLAAPAGRQAGAGSVGPICHLRDLPERQLLGLTILLGEQPWCLWKLSEPVEGLFQLPVVHPALELEPLHRIGWGEVLGRDCWPGELSRVGVDEV